MPVKCLLSACGACVCCRNLTVRSPVHQVRRSFTGSALPNIHHVLTIVVCYGWFLAPTEHHHWHHPQLEPCPAPELLDHCMGYVWFAVCPLKIHRHIANRHSADADTDTDAIPGQTKKTFLVSYPSSLFCSCLPPGEDCAERLEKLDTVSITASRVSFYHWRGALRQFRPRTVQSAPLGLHLHQTNTNPNLTTSLPPYSRVNR